MEKGGLQDRESQAGPSVTPWPHQPADGLGGGLVNKEKIYIKKNRVIGRPISVNQQKPIFIDSYGFRSLLCKSAIPLNLITDS